jgi:hypothetical protein
MSDDPLISQLSKFTPDGSLDRDALLFAAGKASARSNWRWKMLAGALAATQLVILGFILLPTVTPPTTQNSVLPNNVQSAKVADPKESFHGFSGILALHEFLLAEDGSLPHFEFNEPMVPEEVPSRSIGSVPPDFLKKSF